jgi:hypothetical protein
MTRLTWRSILSSGSQKLQDTPNKNVFLEFTLNNPPDDSAAALLILAAKDVHEERSYITINMDRHSTAENDDLNFEVASKQEFFVSRILSTGSTYSTQIHRIAPGRLRKGEMNWIGLHARAADGTTNGNKDDFEVARIFLVYTTTED